MFIKELKSFFKQVECDNCKSCFHLVANFNKHIKICDPNLSPRLSMFGKRGIYNLKINTKQQQLESSSIDMSGHNFVYHFLVAYITEAVLPDSTMEPAAKRVKMCCDINNVPVECKL